MHDLETGLNVYFSRESSAALRAALEGRIDWRSLALAGRSRRQCPRAERSLCFGFEQRSRELRLPNDTQQRAAPDRIVKRNRNRYRRCLQAPLHDPVTASLADRSESILFENPANLRARKNSKPTQPAPQPELRKPRRESAARLRTGRQLRRTE